MALYFLAFWSSRAQRKLWLGYGRLKHLNHKAKFGVRTSDADVFLNVTVGGFKLHDNRANNINTSADIVVAVKIHPSHTITPTTTAISGGQIRDENMRRASDGREALSVEERVEPVTAAGGSCP